MNRLFERAEFAPGPAFTGHMRNRAGFVRPEAA